MKGQVAWTKAVALGRTGVDTLDRYSGGQGNIKDSSQVLALGAWWMEERETWVGVMAPVDPGWPAGRK